jgi:hypothetical protein
MGSNLDKYRLAKKTIAELEQVAITELIDEFHSLTDRLEEVRNELRELGVKKIPEKKIVKRQRKTSNHIVKAMVKGHSEALAEMIQKPDPKPLSPESEKKIRALERKLDTQRKKLGTATAAGADVKTFKAINDRIYEFEDELKLEREKAS